MTRPVILVPDPPFFFKWFVLFYFILPLGRYMLGYVELFFFPFTLISRCEGYSAQAQGGSPGKAPNRAQHGGAAQVFFFPSYGFHGFHGFHGCSKMLLAAFWKVRRRLGGAIRAVFYGRVGFSEAEGSRCPLVRPRKGKGAD